MNYSAIIIDDESLAREMLQEMIFSLYPQMTIVNLASKLLDGVKFIRNNPVDIYF